MHARIHPIGSTRNDVTYKALYDYLNCLSISPCRGWMNSNEVCVRGVVLSVIVLLSNVIATTATLTTTTAILLLLLYYYYYYYYYTQTFRNETTQRAFELNAVYKQIVAKERFAKFDMTYFDCPMNQIADEWKASGGQV